MTKGLGEDPFAVDAIRLELARKGDLQALRASYVAGTFPELPDMSSAQRWDELAACSEVPDFRVRRLKAVAERVPPGSSVLDIGIGWGEVIPMILARGNCRYTGVDFSAQIVERVAHQYPDCRFIAGALDQITTTFDVALALEVLEHILPSRVLRFLEQIRGVLTENGLLVVTVPVHENLRAMTLRCPQCGHLHNRMGHVRAYAPELIAAELQLAGFEVRESFFIYANFRNSLGGRIKRHIANLGRTLLRMGKTTPLNIVIVARKRAHC